MEKRTIVSIIIGIVILIVGVAIGFFYQAQMVSPQLVQQTAVQSQLEKATAAIKILSSKLFISPVAIGKVAKISGRTITLNNGGENLEIAVQGDAKIYSFIVGGQKTAGSIQTVSSFGNIKVGDNLSVNVKILPDGQISGTSVIILPATK